MRFAGCSAAAACADTSTSRVTVIDAQECSRGTSTPTSTMPWSPAHRREGSSLALPGAMTFSHDGSRVYLAAFGSATIAVLDAAAVEAGGDQLAAALAALRTWRCPAAARAASCSTRQASGSTSWRASRTRSTSSTLPPAWRCSRCACTIPSRPRRRRPPHPLRRHARPSNGEASCASCHVFADVDGLAWDLGDPDGAVLPNPNPIRSDTLTTAPDFHPMKGPLTTQTLRGMATHGAMHWRGDRTGGSQPGVDPLHERAAFLQFKPAFADLLGREGPLPEAQMQSLADFALAITSPPNPVRALDGTLNPIQQRGSGSTARHLSVLGDRDARRRTTQQPDQATKITWKPSTRRSACS